MSLYPDRTHSPSPQSPVPSPQQEPAMKKFLLLSIASLAFFVCGPINTSKADVPFPYYMYRHSLYMPWHGPYADAEYGEPLALVVPPTAPFKVEYHWGVGGKRVVPIYHQFA